MRLWIPIVTFLALGMACRAQQPDMRLFIGTWDFRIWGTADITGTPALTGTWSLESGLDSALALVGRVDLNDGPGVQGGTFTRELITFDEHEQLFIRSIVTNTGSTYRFTSSGWLGDKLMWVGTQHGPGGSVDLREEIERTGPDSFSAVFHRRDGEQWVLQSNERLQRRPVK